MSKRYIPIDIARLRAAYAAGLDPVTVVDRVFDAIVPGEAARATDLLVLDADNFLHLLDRLPDIAAKVEVVSRRRMAALGS